MIQIRQVMQFVHERAEYLYDKACDKIEKIDTDKIPEEFDPRIKELRAIEEMLICCEGSGRYDLWLPKDLGD